MFVLSMKTTRPRIIAVAVIVALLLVIMALSRGGAATANATVTLLDDTARREYITSLGYTLDASDAEVREVLLPADLDETLTQYNAMLQQAGYDLDAYRGKRVKCYTYTVTNIPDTAAVVHLYVYKDTVIGGDISSVEADGWRRALTPMTDG